MNGVQHNYPNTKPVKKDRFRWNLSIFHWCVDTNQCADTNQRTDTNQCAYTKLRPYTHVCTSLKKLKFFSLAETRTWAKKNIISKKVTMVRKVFQNKKNKKNFQKKNLKKTFKKKKFVKKFSGPPRATAP